MKLRGQSPKRIRAMKPTTGQFARGVRGSLWVPTGTKVPKNWEKVTAIASGQLEGSFDIYRARRKKPTK